MKDRRKLDTLAIDIVQSIYGNDAHTIWDLIRLLERNIEIRFDTILGKKARNSPELKRVIAYDLGYSQSADTHPLIFEKLSNYNFRLLRRFNEGIMMADFKGWKGDLDYSNHFFLFGLDVLSPRNVGQSLVSDSFSLKTKTVLAELKKVRKFNNNTKSIVAHDLKEMLNRILHGARLLNVTAFKDFLSQADFLSKNRNITEGNTTAVISENWQLLNAAYPKGFSSIRGKSRSKVEFGDFNVAYFAARLIAACRPCDAFILSYLTDEQRRIMLEYGHKKEVAKLAAMFEVCNALNQLLEAGVLRNAHDIYGLDHDGGLMAKISQALAANDTNSLVSSRLSIMQNRHLLQRAFPDHIYARSAKFERWMNYQLKGIFLSERRAAQRREKVSPFQSLTSEQELTEIPAQYDSSIEEDIVIEILEGSCALGSHPAVFFRLLREKYLFGYKDEETVQRLNEERYYESSWTRRRVIETRREALECVGRYMFEHYESIINRLINRYPNKDLRVLCVDRVPSTAFTCSNSKDNFYLFSGYTEAGETIVLPCCEQPDLRAAFNWLQTKGFYGVRWVISDVFENIQSQVQQVFPGAQWQYCHLKIREALSYKRTKKEVMKIISATSKGEGRKLLEAHKELLNDELNFSPDLLLHALNYLDLQFGNDSGEEKVVSNIKRVCRRRSRFKSTRIYKIRKTLGIEKTHTRIQVHGNLEMYLAGKRFISTNAHKVRMPVWDSSK